MIEKELQPQPELAITEVRPFIQGIQNLLQRYSELDLALPQLIVNGANQLTRPHLNWEIVRKARRLTPVATGFEGYLAGVYQTPQEIAYFIAQSTQTELDALVRANQYEFRLRKELENCILGNSLKNPQALRRAERLFIDVRSKLLVEHVQKAPPNIRLAKIEANTRFKDQTVSLGLKVKKPEILFDTSSGQLLYEMELPEITPVPTSSVGSLPKDGQLFAENLGKIGMPVVRLVLQKPELMAWLDMSTYNGRVNFAPKHSPLYQELRSRLAYRTFKSFTS